MNKAHMWLPDTFISNSVQYVERSSSASDGDLRGAFHYLRISPNGDVLYSQMVDVVCHSIMYVCLFLFFNSESDQILFRQLEYFPYHIVTLHLMLESYGYSNEDVEFSFNQEPLTFEERRATVSVKPRLFVFSANCSRLVRHPPSI